MDTSGNQSNTVNDKTQKISVSGLLPLGNRDIRNNVEKSNFLSGWERDMLPKVTASVDDRSAADGERDDSDFFVLALLPASQCVVCHRNRRGLTQLQLRLLLQF